jgi:hypothetical protein
MAALNYAPACGCGNPLKVFASTGRAAQACSKACSKRKNNGQSRRVCWLRKCWGCGARISAKSAFCTPCYLARKAELKTGRCKGCGKTFAAKSKRHSTYCSRACAFKNINTWRVGVKASGDHVPKFSKLALCERCEAPIRPKRKWCHACKPIALKNREAERIAARVCKLCGCNNPRKKVHYCAECARRVKREASRRAKDKVRATRGHRWRSVARFYGVEYERIERPVVFARDGWRCQICLKSTPKQKMGTNAQDAPTLDHRIPISKGGAHTYANAQCACRKCNSWKSDRFDVGQLPLFNQKGGGVPAF